ncbi:protein of unassigned function [Methylobacterium oryzae CBMB20]|uniref:Protein of unassigned function n=1 Tax=Methylobacterium oryzae CBMB20 TaxID=693986 RepID=A0A089P022_9HYPH|nr:protein of unassigned function [Methylobacterium oryzae CBMB20]
MNVLLSRAGAPSTFWGALCAGPGMKGLRWAKSRLSIKAPKRADDASAKLKWRSGPTPSALFCVEEVQFAVFCARGRL